MKKKLLTLFIALFLLACIVPTAALCIAGPAPEAANEIAASKPKLVKLGKLNDEFLSDLSEYVAQGFRPRLWFINLWDSLCADVLHTSVNDDVVLGRDDWMFFYTAVEDRSGSSLLSDATLWRCGRNVYLMQEYAESIGADFLFVMPNAKYDLYPEYVRDYVSVQDGRNVDKLQSVLSDMGVNYCDMYALFSGQDEILYWHTDSHWNGKGAALAADGILSGLGYESEWFGGEFTDAAPHKGDLYEMLFPTGSYTEPDYTPAEGFDFEYVSDFSTVNDMEIQTACDDGEGVLLMYRDSFGRNLYPYLADSFAEATFSRENSYDICRAETLNATDIVVELGQRNAEYLLQYTAVFPAPERDEAALDNAEEIACEVSASEAGSALESCIFVSAADEALCGAESVYLEADGCIWEASLTENGCAAYLPSDTAAENIRVFTAK